jgi:NADH dehydrogenase FAD-containing subunit
MKKHLVLIGGGHAHMVTLANLESFIDKGFGVTVIQPSEYHYYSGMGPGMLGGTYRPDDIRFATRRQVEAKGGRFILGKASGIDPVKQLVSLEGMEEKIPYDVLSCNAGSFVPREMVRGDSRNVFTAKPIEELLVAQKRILELAAAGRITVAVVGSGPSSLEIAGNVHQLCRERELNPPCIQVFSGRNFLSGRPERVRLLARRMLTRKGVEIIEDGYVRQIEADRIVLENGQEYKADIIFPAVGVRPSPIFAGSGLPVGPDGGLRVNDYLQSVAYQNIFGGGDCVYFEAQPLDKVGVYAVRQNPVLFGNLMAGLEGRPLARFTPGGKYLLIYNLGDGEGILSKWSITFSGRLAFSIKDWIDRRFIRAFQEN